MHSRDPLSPRIYPSSQIYPRAPDVMSIGEIREWLTLLHEQYGWPWETLGRTLGIGEGKHVASKVRGNSWFVGGEQARCSRQLRRIISGELVPSPPNKFGRRDAMIADTPHPIRGATRWAYNLKSGRIVWWTVPLPGPTLPSLPQGIERLLGALRQVDSD